MPTRQQQDDDKNLPAIVLKYIGGIAASALVVLMTIYINKQDKATLDRDNIRDKQSELKREIDRNTYRIDDLKRQGEKLEKKTEELEQKNQDLKEEVNRMKYERHT